MLLWRRNTGRTPTESRPQTKENKVSFQRIWEQQAGEFDLGTLQGELAKLRVALQAEAQDADQAISLGETARAEKALAAGDGPAMLEHLRQAGPWALEVCSSTRGVDLAYKALKLALAQR